MSNVFNIVWANSPKDLELWVVGCLNQDGSTTYRYDNTPNEDDDKIVFIFVSRFVDNVRCYIISYETPLEDVFDSCYEDDEDDPVLTEKYENIFLVCLEDYFARNHLYSDHDLGIFISDYMRFRPQTPLFLTNAIDRFILARNLSPYVKLYRPGQAQPYFGYSCRKERD